MVAVGKRGGERVVEKRAQEPRGRGPTGSVCTIDVTMRQRGRRRITRSGDAQRRKGAGHPPLAVVELGPGETVRRYEDRPALTTNRPRTLGDTRVTRVLTATDDQIPGKRLGGWSCIDD